MGLLERGMNYYDYSVNKTFYRSTRTLRNIFSRNGFTFKHGSSYIPEVHPDKSSSNWSRIKKQLLIKFFKEELYLINHTNI
jgi:hypothetical protein